MALLNRERYLCPLSAALRLRISLTAVSDEDAVPRPCKPLEKGLSETLTNVAESYFVSSVSQTIKNEIVLEKKCINRNL